MNQTKTYIRRETGFPRGNRIKTGESISWRRMDSLRKGYLGAGAASCSRTAGAECASTGGVLAFATAAIPTGSMWPAGPIPATEVAAAGASVGAVAPGSTTSTRMRAPSSSGTLSSPCSEAVGELVTSIAVVGVLPVMAAGVGAVDVCVLGASVTVVTEIIELPVAVVTEVDVCTMAMVAGEAAMGVGTIDTLPGVELVVFCDYAADCGSFTCECLTGPAPPLLVFARVRAAEPSTSGSRASLSLSGATGFDILAEASSVLLAASRGLVRVGLATLDLGFAIGVFGGVFGFAIIV